MSKDERTTRYARRKDRANKFRRDGRRVWGNPSWVAKWDGYGPEGKARGAASLADAHAAEINAAFMLSAAQKAA